jgi:formylglycine-generating enzyme required for sulfatase activity/tRNA A-37 threonylcarbamoyl transferase component Bud32
MQNSQSPDSASPIDDVVAEFIRRIDAGERIDVARFCAGYPADMRAAIEERCRVYLQTHTLLSSPRSGDETGALVGRQLDDFLIQKRIGHGGVGEVYLATQVSLQRTVALKRLRAGLLASDRQLVRFRREAVTNAKLVHPGIVPIHAIGACAGEHYIVMEHVQGRSLSDHLRDALTAPGRNLAFGARPGQSSVNRIAEIVAQVAEALAYAHEHGVIHRDVKPHNIVLDERDMRPRLVDFGLALVAGVETITDEGEIAGSSYYMSPEQTLARRVPIDHRTDIFSLGIVLFELLTGRRPFDGETRAEILFAIAFKEPSKLRLLNREVPRDLEIICMKALEKNPNRRYATAAAMAGDLRAFLDHKAILARPPGPMERTWRVVVRRRLPIAAAGLMVASLVSGAFAYQSWSRHREMQAEEEWLQSLACTDITSCSAEALKSVVQRIDRMSDAASPDGRSLAANLRARIEDYGRQLKAAGLSMKEGYLNSNQSSPSLYVAALNRLREASLLLPDDEELQRSIQVTEIMPKLTVTTAEPGARVSCRLIDQFTGVPGEKRSIGTTPVRSFPLEPGYYRIIVEDEAVGFAELTRELFELGREYEVQAEIHPTEEDPVGMVRIPAGPCVVGQRYYHHSETCRHEQISSEHTEDLPEYFIDRCEVSNLEYREFVRVTGHRQPYTWRDPSGPTAFTYRNEWDDLPVIGISWYDARAYAEWRGLRLPTHAEWQKAARGDHGLLYPWGRERRPGWANIAKGQPLHECWWRLLEPVRSMEEGLSPYGLYHTLGNAEEWTETIAVVTLTDREVPLTSQRFALGGSFAYDAEDTLDRYAFKITWDSVESLIWTGIRCAKSAKP